MSSVTSNTPQDPTNSSSITNTGQGSGGSGPGTTDLSNLLNGVMSLIQSAGTNLPPTNVNTVKAQVADSLASSGVSATGNSVPPTNPNTPNLPVASATAALGAGFKSNAWLKPSSAAVFLKLELALAFVMTKIKLADISTQVKLLKAKQESVEANAKNIMDKAMIEFTKAICQAVVQFASAAISVGMAVMSMRSGVMAKNEVANEAEMLKHNPNVDKTAIGPDGKTPDTTGVSAWSQKNDIYQEKLEAYNKNPTTANKMAMDKARNEADAIKPGFDQINKYMENRGWVKPSETNPNELPKTNDPSIELKNERAPKNSDEIALQENKDSNVIAKNEQKDGNEIANEHKTLQEKKLTDEDLKEDVALSNTTKKDVESKDAKDAKLEKDLNTIKQHEEEGYNERIDPNSRGARSAKDTKISQYTQAINAINSINTSLTQAVNGIIGAVFDLAKAEKEQEAVYIQANIEQLSQLFDSFEQDRKNVAQDVTGLFSTIMNYLEAMGRIASFTSFGT